MASRCVELLLISFVFVSNGLLVQDSQQEFVLATSGSSRQTSQTPAAPPTNFVGHRRFAFMFIGKSMTFGETSRTNKFVKLGHVEDQSIFDNMVGDMDEDDTSKSPYHEFQLGFLESFTDPLRPWQSFENHVLSPLGEEASAADVYVCADALPAGVKPAGVTVFVVQAANQWDRLHMCYEKVKGLSKSYDFFVKSRPDFIHVTDVNLKNLRTDRLYSRFRLAQNIEGMKSGMFSVGFCDMRCPMEHPEESWKVGYMNDDMFFVGHASLWDRVAVDHARQKQLMAQYQAVKNQQHKEWIRLWNGFEGEFTQALLQQGVVSEPLDMVCYPAHSRFNWALHWKRCNFKSRPSKDCGPNPKSIDAVNVFSNKP